MSDGQQGGPASLRRRSRRLQSSVPGRGLHPRRVTPSSRQSGPFAVAVAGLGLLGTLVLAACSGPATSASGTGALTSSGSPTPTSTVSIPPGAQWCATYTAVTKVLAETGSTPEGAQTALKALETFDQLWDVSDEIVGLTPEEVDANRRAVAAYVAVEKLVSEGADPQGAEVRAATSALTATTEKDRQALAASAQKVLTKCGGVTSTPSSKAS